MSSMGARARLMGLADQTTPPGSQIFTQGANQMNTLLARPESATTMLDERAQLDPGWADVDIAAIVEDFLRAQLDPGLKAQIDPGIKAQLDPGTKAQLDAGTKAQL